MIGRLRLFLSSPTGDGGSESRLRLRSPCGSLRASLAGLVLLWAIDARAQDAIVLQERVPLAFVLVTPTGEAANTRSSDLIGLLSDELEQRTNFSLLILDPDLVRECRGRLLCLVLKTRSDYSPEDLRRPEGGYFPYRQHLEQLAERRMVYAEYLLVLSNLTRPGDPDRLNAQLINTDNALERYHEAERAGSEWEARVEAAIDESSTRTGRTEVRSLDDARSYVRSMLGQLAPILQQSGNWDPYGRIELRDSSAGHAVLLDGTTVGTTRAGSTFIERVTPGERVIGLQSAGLEPFEQKIIVRRHETVIVEPQLIAASSSGAGNMRRTMIWGGSAVAIAGAALLTIAIIQQDGGVRSLCIEDSASCSSGRAFQSSGFDSEARGFNAANPPGLLFGPLGYSLIATGGTWIAGGMFDQSEGTPWLPLIGGLLIGAGAYTISALVAGPSGASE